MGSGTSSWMLIAGSVVLFILLLWVERRAADPVLPLPLFRDPLFATATAHGIFTGWALFGSVSFIPLFVQAVLGTSATQAGITLTPLLMGWVTGEHHRHTPDAHRRLSQAGADRYGELSPSALF